MKIAATILVAGSALFQLGAFLPVSRFYMSSTDEKLAIMQNQTVQWMLHLAGMGFGALIAAVGLLTLLPRLPKGLPSTLGTIAVMCVTVGTLLWLWHLQLRIGAPEAFAAGANPIWHFALYTVLMQMGLLLLAGALHFAGWPPWMVLVPAIGTGLTILALAVFRDVPPFTHYVWLLAVGIGLLVSERLGDL